MLAEALLLEHSFAGCDGPAKCEVDCARCRDASATKMLIAQRRRESESLALAVHELRGPLGPIRNVSALLAGGGDTIPLAKLASLLDRQVRHMARLIDDLLDVSRIETGRLHVSRTRIDLVRLLGLVVEASLPAMNARTQHFTVCIPAEPLMVDADEVRLTQAFTNLLNNASKYTPENGEITLTCTVERNGAESDIASVIVSDNGVGITSAALPTIFEPFVQDQHAVRFSAEGLGIGLTLVRELVQAHGGTVTAASPGPGCGSRFEVRLPLIERRQAPSATSGPAGLAREMQEFIDFTMAP